MNNFDSITIYQKIDRIMTDKGISIYTLSKRSGIPPSTIYNWRDRKSSPNLDLLRRICNTLNISAAKLFTNDSDSLSLGEKQKQLVHYFDILNDSMQNVVLELLKEMAKK